MDKPVGWTSHDVVAVVRRALGTRSVGHAGTLDPFATGLLVVLVGRATRLARFIEGAAKQYDATIRLGTATDTEDATGTVTRELTPEVWPDEATIAGALGGLVGTQWQVPPAYSAKHVDGTRSYALARAGRAVELPPVEVTVHALELLEWSPPDATVSARVGRGTYLRAIARDLGERLSLPAHCAGLRRTAIGPFRVDDAIAPGAVSAASVLSPAAMVCHLTRDVVSVDAARELGFGRSVPQSAAADGTGALLAEDGRLLAVAEGREGRWHPVVVLEPST
ncbi:MAG: tRNA pseudouridine(55) synthase TruB [Gemmatimonadota bacterium]